MSEARIREAFAAFDADRSGTISASEMKKILSRGDSQLLSADEVDELIREFDTNGDGQLSLSEFAAACASMDDDEAEALSAKLDEHVVKVAFDVFDLDSDGVLNRSDLSAILKRQEWDAPSFEPLISSGEMDEKRWLISLCARMAARWSCTSQSARTPLSTSSSSIV
jgi:Ca2+-binding EF-hand superfamily protein